ncbi:hypothetical protein C0992_012803 [Termitomyces sp. T32_za158]|nr:hypothetical protein C0992_012803 [Termitomyces sp. T32_za158]
MPEGWKNVPENKKWLHTLFLGIDANFWLKRKDVSSDALDPDLGNGFAYFVQDQPYKEHLEKYKNEVEPKSNCSRHDAVNLANSKPSQGHAATGVGTIECIRHDMKRPCSVGDLQVGERYFVPKFHLPAHVVGCRTSYSFNYGLGVGRTDGEAPERGWAEVDPLAASTKEMGPGSRRDTLDSHFGDYNWRKTIGMGRSLLRKFNVATTDMADHVIAHMELTASLPQDLVSKWTAEIEAWEKNPKEAKTNPLESNVETPSQAAVCRELAQTEAQEAGTTSETSLDNHVSPSVLITCGLDIESEQRSLKAEAAKIWEHSQDRQHTRLQLRCNALQRKITAWSKVQQLYVAGVVTLRNMEETAAAAQKTPLKPYMLSLWLPSQIGSKITFDINLANIEWKLRYAQAFEALEALRSNLQVRSHLYKFKDRFIRGQHANTRARGAIETVQARIQAAADEYRAAYKALNSLSTLLGEASWRTQLLPLDPADIRKMSEADNDHMSEGRRKVSWIWKTLGVINERTDSDQLRDALRIEWCKSRARSMRFSEEVELLTEEMHRVLRYCSYREQWWKAKTQFGTEDLASIRREGLQACAERQAALWAALRDNFSWLWRGVPAALNNLQTYLSTFAPVASRSDHTSVSV